MAEPLLHFARRQTVRVGKESRQRLAIVSQVVRPAGQGDADERVLDRYERQRRPIAEEEIIQQAHRNRTRMQERDPERRGAMLKDLQQTIDDPLKLKAYLMKSSMIDGLRRAAATE